MTAIRKHVHITRPVRPAVPTPAAEDVDDEPLTEAEIAALAANDGTYVSWDDLKAELNL
ncbi:MAG: hypothetical protein HQL37_08675 [Alphaproteobacteria bacterium]|nr:hypothetical protein [Alphaproteobacteria bacterium]